MEPINKSERRKALLNFMLLFLACTGIIVTTVFTSTRVPFSENNVLLQVKKDAEKKNDLQKEVTQKVSTISSIIDSLDKIKINDFTQLDLRINEEIKGLNEITVNADVEDKKLYANISTNLSYYYAAKKAVQQKNDDNSDVKSLNDEIKTLERERDQWKKDYFDLKTSGK